MDIIARDPLKVMLSLPEKVANILTTAILLPISDLIKPAPPQKKKATMTATYWAAFPPVLRRD